MPWIEQAEFRHPNPRRIIRRGFIALFLVVAALALTFIGFFHPTLPLWLAGLPLIGAIVIGKPLARAIAMTAFLLWPIAASAYALVTLDYSALLVWPLAVLSLGVLATAAAGIGIFFLTLLLTLLVVFPASPVLLIADALPGTGLIGPLLLLIGLGFAETRRHLWQRSAAVFMLSAATLAWGQYYQRPEPPEVAWRVVSEPRMITERARWIALRDSLPPGSQAIFGENVFKTGNHAAVAFWCEAVRSRALTLWIGVMAENRRGQVWRFDPQTCPRPAGGAVIVHAARYGIPGLTGTWRAMDPVGPNGDSEDTNPNGPSRGSEDTDNTPAWLICYEAFLPWAWIPVLTAQNPARPIVILSNDRAFGTLPLPTLRHKVSRAMAALTGRTVLHAETGRHFLLKGPE